MKKLSAVALLALLVVGCGSSGPRHDIEWWHSFYIPPAESGSYTQPDPRVQFELTLAPTEIEAGLAELETARLRSQDEVSAQLAVQEQQRVDQVAQQIAFCYEKGLRGVGQELVTQHPDVYSWEEASQVVEINATFEHVKGGLVELTLDRTEAPDGPLAVSFPPGTYAVPIADYGVAGGESESGEPWVRPNDERRFGEWPRPQDLGFLRAPVIQFAPGQTRATLQVPVACASFHLKAPEHSQKFELRRFPENSPIDRLMQALCAGPFRPSDAEAQLAVWMARNDITFDDFFLQGGTSGRLVTFNSREPIRPYHTPGAARLLIQSGIDPRDAAFFGAEGGQLLEGYPSEEEGSPAEETPPVEPEPQPEALDPGDLS